MNWKYIDINRIGSPDNCSIFDHDEDELVIEEKVDGGCGCFFLKDGLIHVCSRNRDLTAENDKQTFQESQKWIYHQLQHKEVSSQFYYYFEHMQKHTIDYGKTRETTPIIGFDIKPKEGIFGRRPAYLGRRAKEAEFNRLGIPCISLKWMGLVKDFKNQDINELLKTSAYYEKEPEGIVIKNYQRANDEGNQMFAKIVREDFKELNRAVFGELKKDKNDSERFIELFLTDARIKKRIHALVQEQGLLLKRSLMQFLVIESLKDIFKEELPLVMKETKELNFPIIKRKAAKRCLAVLDQEIILNRRENEAT